MSSASPASSSFAPSPPPSPSALTRARQQERVRLRELEERRRVRENLRRLIDAESAATTGQNTETRPVSTRLTPPPELTPNPNPAAERETTTREGVGQDGEERGDEAEAEAHLHPHPHLNGNGDGDAAARGSLLRGGASFFHDVFALLMQSWRSFVLPGYRLSASAMRLVYTFATNILGVISYRLYVFIAFSFCCLGGLTGLIAVGQGIEASTMPMVRIGIGALQWVPGLGYQSGAFTRWSRESVCPVLPLQGALLGLDLGICPKLRKGTKYASDRRAGRNEEEEEEDFDALFKNNEHWLLIVNKEAEVERAINTLQQISISWTSIRHSLIIHSGLCPALQQPLSSQSSPETYTDLLTTLANLTQAQATELSQFRHVPNLLVLMLSQTRWALSTTSSRRRSGRSSAEVRTVRKDYIAHLDDIVQTMQPLLMHFDAAIQAHHQVQAIMLQVSVQTHRHEEACKADAQARGGWFAAQREPPQCSVLVRKALKSIRTIERTNIGALVWIHGHAEQRLDQVMTLRRHMDDHCEMRRKEMDGKTWLDYLTIKDGWDEERRKSEGNDIDTHMHALRSLWQYVTAVRR
ncbi:hypothetical protein LZ554_009590 [Drepanopeziza brunnea f. sp. 'monogermtubi']|nr:hypothetical protein LZ554_009590 [Drepanopeziza brunnea f. sp. 'monogermtubi']